MALSYLLDENLLSGPLWHAIQQHNGGGHDAIDVVRVGDPACPPRGTLDPQVLIWAEQQGRILVSLDESTMPGFLTAHLAAGRRSPGVFLVRGGQPLPAIVAELVLRAHAGDPAHYADCVNYLP
jgi:hypothetical protein